jgi:hypothetical protein
MSRTLIVNNIPFEYPEQGEQQPWGEAATNWADEVTKVLAFLKGPYDVLENSQVVNYNQTTPLLIDKLFFDSCKVRTFKILGNITRTSNSVSVYETFELTGTYQDAQGWVLQKESMSNASVVFSVDLSGQVFYVSSPVGDSGTHSGLLKFKAIALSQI